MSEKAVKQKVRFNLIAQDVYILPACGACEDKKDYLDKEYISQDEVTEGNSVVVKSTIQEYPITPESVNSFADGTNYRLDPAGAIARGGPAGRNIGDVAALQELLSKSPEEASKLLAKWSEMIAAAKAPAPAAAPVPVDGGATDGK